MMGREIKRVPLDFDWPLNVIWPGYCIEMSFYKNYGHYTKDNLILFFELMGMEREYLDTDNPDNNLSELHDEVHDRCCEFDPPTGKGYQVWETCSEGSPISPVFDTPEALAGYAVENCTVFGQMKGSYDEWLAWANGSSDIGVGSMMGVVVKDGEKPVVTIAERLPKENRDG